MKLRNLLSQLTLLIVLNLIVACQSTLISTEEAQAPVDLTAEHGGETPSPMLATQEPEPTATQSVAENLDDVEPEVPEEDSQEVISETVSTELNPIVIKLPPENVQEVILSPTRINLPEDAVTQYEGTEQYVSALAFDETNALWAQIGGQTVRWNIDDGSYAIVESPTGLLKIEDIDCYSLAEELSLPTFPADCVLGPDNTYWFSTYGEGIYNHVDGEWMHITADDGLPENEIRGLAFDQDGNLQQKHSYIAQGV